MNTRTRKPVRKIFSVTIKRMVDTSPDTSHLGEYSDKPTSPFSIDRKHAEDCPQFWYRWEMLEQDEEECEGCASFNSHEYRYFNPSFNYVDKAGEALPENTPDEVRKYTLQDYERMERLNAGDWCYIGVEAIAVVGISLDGGRMFKTDRITSGGLWGIESDSDAPYIASEEKSQLEELREYLVAYGFGRSRIAQAFKDAKHADE